MIDDVLPDFRPIVMDKVMVSAARPRRRRTEKPQMSSGANALTAAHSLATSQASEPIAPATITET